MNTYENLDDLFEQAADGHKEEEQPQFSPYDKEEYKAQKKQERDELYAMMGKTAESIKGSGERLQNFLDVMARFDRYSVNNLLLITAQAPRAVRLEDYDTWKEQNVFVNKGMIGISILEPGKQYEREDGTTGTSFKVKKVFDISQTNCQDPVPIPRMRDARLLIKSLIANAPCTMTISDNMPEKYNAVYRPEEKAIYVRSGLEAPTLFRCLSNEIALAHMNKGNYRRSERKDAAYLVSYVLCKRFGVPTDSFSFDSVPGSLANLEEVKDFRAELANIRTISNQISRDMDRVIDEQTRAKKDRSDEAR